MSQSLCLSRQWLCSADAKQSPSILPAVSFPCCLQATHAGSAHGAFSPDATAKRRGKEGHAPTRTSRNRESRIIDDGQTRRKVARINSSHILSLTGESENGAKITKFEPDRRFGARLRLGSLQAEPRNWLEWSDPLSRAIGGGPRGSALTKDKRSPRHPAGPGSMVPTPDQVLLCFAPRESARLFRFAPVCARAYGNGPSLTLGKPALLSLLRALIYTSPLHCGPPGASVCRQAGRRLSVESPAGGSKVGEQEPHSPAKGLSPERSLPARRLAFCSLS